MAKLRSLSTAFWSDPFIEELTPQQKLLFIYLVTNDKTNMLGIYESTVRKMSFETGIDKKNIESALNEFKSKGKVKYINNYVILVNYMKHQNYNTNMKKSAIDTYNNLPKELKIKDLTVSKDNPLKGFESLLNHYGMVSKYEYEYEDETKLEDEYKIANFKERKQKFITWFNEQKKIKTGRKGTIKILSSTDDNNLKRLFKEYKIEDFKIALDNMFKSTWAVENGMCNISHLIRIDNFNKYLGQGVKDGEATKTGKTFSYFNK